VQIIGVSFDPPEANRGFAEKNRFSFPLLTDRARTLALAFGAAERVDARYAKRVSVLIDERGRVEKLYPSVDPRTHAEEVLRDLGRGRSAPAP
jgi:peroxiredoxin Q/BCP